MATLMSRAAWKISEWAALGAQRGPHVTRYAMYRRLRAVVPAVHPTVKILSISGSTPLARTLFPNAAAGLVEANFPTHNLLDLGFPGDSFDGVVTDQVLEHVEGNPQQAIDESRRVLKPGGLAIHTTCFINPIHREPGDFWRFTPEALRWLCRDFSTVLEAGGWGNPLVWAAVGAGLRFQPVPEARWHPLYRLAMWNSENWPISTWIVARK